MEEDNLLTLMVNLAKQGNKEKLSALIKSWDNVAPNQSDKSQRVGFVLPKDSLALTEEETDFFAEVLITFVSLTHDKETDLNYLKILGLFSDFILSDKSRKEVIKNWNRKKELKR